MIKMRCHYEVLGVTHEASNEELKKAYRRLALIWHPDKNLTDANAAKEQFLLVQQAYEVLSDSHERAWYDNHRDAILKGGIGENYKDESLDLFQYFTASCFKGFEDDKTGFYSVYREVFNVIINEESEFNTKQDSSDFEIPTFGKSNSSYEDVVRPFYAYWESFCTMKTYSWLEPYDSRQAPCRRTSRLTEKENKKVRDRAKKDRNEQVRTLVLFVRKRDKRVQAYKKYLQEKSAENIKKNEEQRMKIIQERKKEIAHYKESEWSKFSNVEKELKEIEASLVEQFGDNDSMNGDSNDECQNESSSNHLLCVACNKVFKTQKAFQNHENSKKHRDNVEILKQIMANDDLEIGDERGDLELLHYNNFADVISSDNQDVEDEESIVSDDVDSEELIRSEEVINYNKISSPKKVNKITVVGDSNTDLDEELESDLLLTEQIKSSRESLSLNADDVVNAFHLDADKVNEQIDTISEAPVKLKGKEAKEAKRQLKAFEDICGNPKETGSDEPSGSSGVLKSSSHHAQTNKRMDQANLCATCSSSFPSKNKLYDHLKKTGHAVPIHDQCKGKIKIENDISQRNARKKKGRKM